MLTPIQQTDLERVRDARALLREFVRADSDLPEPVRHRAYRQLSSELMNALLVAQRAGVPDLAISEAFDGQPQRNAETSTSGPTIVKVGRDTTPTEEGGLSW